MKISVLGLWRDSASYAERTLSNLSDIVYNNPSIDFNFFFYENDSRDNTKQILDNWIGKYSGEIYSETLNMPKFGSTTDITRLILLSYYRNKLKDLCIDKLESKYTLLIDTDIIFDKNHLSILLEQIEALQAAMVVANTRQNAFGDLMLQESKDTFYDAFALRDRYNQIAVYMTDCPMTISTDRELWKNNQPVRLLSGFSGFALLHTDIFKECKWSTTGHSEHINFCYEINRFGSIFIIPSCKPTTDVDISMLNIPELEKNVQLQLNTINNINSIYETSISSKIVPK
jgi:hypothetical protein